MTTNARTADGSGNGPHDIADMTTGPELLHGLRTGEVRLDYQPEFDLRTRRMRAVEALARWDHPTLGALGADSFVHLADHLAEQDELIVEFGTWALRTACVQYCEWQRADPGLDLVLRVNVSALLLSEPSIVDVVRQTLADADMQPSSLCLEVTEKAEPVDVLVTASVLASVRALGVAIALDDFGTGRNGLLELREIPFDVVKIDRAFVTQLTRGSRDAHIIEAVVNLARAIGFEVVAEGVENEAALEELLRLGCHRGQGYMLGEPVPADQVMTRFAQLPPR